MHLHTVLSWKTELAQLKVKAYRHLEESKPRLLHYAEEHVMNNDNSTISAFLTFPCFASLAAFTFKSQPLFSLVSLHCHVAASLFLQYYDFFFYHRAEPMLSPPRETFPKPAPFLWSVTCPLNFSPFSLRMPGLADRKGEFKQVDSTCGKLPRLRCGIISSYGTKVWHLQWEMWVIPGSEHKCSCSSRHFEKKQFPL